MPHDNNGLYIFLGTGGGSVLFISQHTKFRCLHQEEKIISEHFYQIAAWYDTCCPKTSCRADIAESFWCLSETERWSDSSRFSWLVLNVCPDLAPHVTGLCTFPKDNTTRLVCCLFFGSVCKPWISCLWFISAHRFAMQSFHLLCAAGINDLSFSSVLFCTEANSTLSQTQWWMSP